VVGRENDRRPVFSSFSSSHPWLARKLQTVLAGEKEHEEEGEEEHDEEDD
jgi:hypothetical protein